MKNKIKIFYICLCFFFFNTNIYSLEKFYYEADDLKILDNGNILESDNTRVAPSQDIGPDGQFIKYRGGKESDYGDSFWMGTLEGLMGPAL